MSSLHHTFQCTPVCILFLLDYISLQMLQLRMLPVYAHWKTDTVQTLHWNAAAQHALDLNRCSTLHGAHFLGGQYRRSPTAFCNTVSLWSLMYNLDLSDHKPRCVVSASTFQYAFYSKDKWDLTGNLFNAIHYKKKHLRWKPEHLLL